MEEFQDTPPTPAVLHQSTLRPVLMMGAEREALMMTVLFAAVVAFAISTIPATIVIGILLMIAVAVLQRMASIDPQMTKIYINHIRQKAFYSGNAFYRPSVAAARKR